VWNVIRARFEAISVMDGDHVEELGEAEEIGKEIQCLFMLSEMVKTGICPNYVNTYQVILVIIITSIVVVVVISFFFFFYYCYLLLLFVIIVLLLLLYYDMI
jgi:hypothetical protein